MQKDKAHRQPGVFKKSFALAGAGIFLILSILLLFTQSMVNASEPQEEVTTISLHAVPGLQYDLVRFSVKPGAKVKLVLTNKDDMSHNLLITKPGTREAVVDEALKLEEKGPVMDYIPGSSDVLWSIPVLSPGEAKTITFNAPAVPGVYPYVCTFPGHGFSMYGAMYVTVDEKLPELQNDLNIPPARRNGDADKNDHSSHRAKATSAHPYDPVPPYLYRVYMENASPAAIAVHLPNELSYCWDAGTCELLYAWEGGFVDNSGPWKGKPNAVAKILGNIFFQQKTSQPLRIGNPQSIQVVEFKGYQLINRYPEFHYTLNGVDVYEIIQPAENGGGLVRSFRIPAADKNVWFYRNINDGVEYQTSAGNWKNNSLLIPPAQAKKFTIVMRKKEEEKL